MTMMEQPALPVRALVAAEGRKRKSPEDPDKDKVSVKDRENDHGDKYYKKLNDISSVLGTIVANRERDQYREIRQPNNKYSQRDDRRDDRRQDNREWRGGRVGRGGNGRGRGGRRDHDDHRDGRREHAGIARQESSRPYKRRKSQAAGGSASPDMSDEEYTEHAYLARAADSNRTIGIDIKTYGDNEVEFIDLYGKEKGDLTQACRIRDAGPTLFKGTAQQREPDYFDDGDIPELIGSDDDEPTDNGNTSTWARRLGAREPSPGITIKQCFRITDPRKPEPDLREMAGPIQMDEPKTIDEVPMHTYLEAVKHIEWSMKAAVGTDDPDLLFGQPDRDGSTGYGRTSIYVRELVWDSIPPAIQKRWHLIAKVKLVPFDYNPREERTTDLKHLIMDIKDETTFIRQAHHLLVNESDDEMIEWYALVIRVAWSSCERRIPINREQALVKVMDQQRQFLLRWAASSSEPVNVGEEGEWICTTPIGDIEPNTVLKGFYRNFRTGVNKAYGETSRIFPNFDKTDMVVVEAKTACGERHELTRKASPTTEVTTNVGPVQPTGTTTLLHQLSEDRDKEIEGAQEYIKGTVPPSPTGTPRRPRTRFVAMMESAVIPNPEYPSDWDGDQEQPQGRPATGRKSTARA